MIDFLMIFAWLLFREILSLPLRCWLVNCPMPDDVRRILSRVAGPLILIIPLWLSAHLNAAHGILSESFGRLWIFVWLCVGLLYGWKHSPQIAHSKLIKLLGYQKNPSYGFELITFLMIIGFVAFRRWVPEMTFEIGASAAEKFGNSAIFWSCWNTQTLPPQDYWLAGTSLIYYYFGHFFWAWFGRIGGFPSEIAINLALIGTVLMTWESAWLLARAFKLSGIWAIIATGVTTWGGNPAALIEVWKAFELNPDEFSFGNYDFWGPSRAISNVVDEFPAFSSILGDVHAHHLALPWIITWIAIAVAGKRWIRTETEQGITLWTILPTASVISNLWNLPLIIWGVLVQGSYCLWAAFHKHQKPNVLKFLIYVVLLGFCLWVGTYLIRGNAPSPLPSNKFPIQWTTSLLRTSPLEWFGMWGFPIIILGTWIALGCRRYFSTFRPDLLLWMLGGVLSVLIGIEIIYVADRFEGEFARYNAYFKFTYPLWPLLYVAATILAKALWTRPKSFSSWLIKCGLLLIFGGTCVYPIFAFPARIIQASGGDSFPRKPTLNAYRFLEYRDPWAIEAPVMEWLRQHSPNDSRIAEAPGIEQYTYHGRTASLGGRACVLGWAHHEQQWRGEAGYGLINERIQDLDRFYLAQDADSMRHEAKLLGIDFAIFGILEIERYGTDPLTVLNAAANAVPDLNTQIYLFDFRSERQP